MLISIESSVYSISNVHLSSIKSLSHNLTKPVSETDRERHGMSTGINYWAAARNNITNNTKQSAISIHSQSIIYKL